MLSPIAGDDPTADFWLGTNTARYYLLKPLRYTRSSGEGAGQSCYLWEEFPVTLFRRTLSTLNVIYATTACGATASVFRHSQLIPATKTWGTGHNRKPIELKFPCLIRYAASWRSVSRESVLSLASKHLTPGSTFM